MCLFGEFDGVHLRDACRLTSYVLRVHGIWLLGNSNGDLFWIQSVADWAGHGGSFSCPLDLPEQSSELLQTPFVGSGGVRT